MAKKQPKNELISDGKTELSGAKIAEMAMDIQEIAEKLQQIAQKMKDRGIDPIRSRGVATWEDAYRRMKGSTASIERAWIDASSVRKSVAEKREKFESTGDQ